MQVPTIKVVSAGHPRGYVIINVADFDAATMVAWTSVQGAPTAVKPDELEWASGPRILPT